MKIFLITENNDDRERWDFYDSFVVGAWDEQEALDLIKPQVSHEGNTSTRWTLSSVECIGITNNFKTEAHIICSSFNAG